MPTPPPNILRLCDAPSASADCRRLRAIPVLQAQLPEIFAEAYAAKEDKQAPVTLWGVQIDPANPRDARVSVVLVKFLRARSASVSVQWPMRQRADAGCGM